MEPRLVIDYRRIGSDELTDEVKKVLIDLHALAFGDEMQNPFHQRFAWFVDHWGSRPGFVCVIGYEGAVPIGFAYGAPATPGKEWWAEHWVPEGAETSTFSISELAVGPRWRKAGEGQRLLEQLLDGRPEAIAVLLVDSAHTKVVAKYKEWGYLSVGDQRPFPDSPLYEVMVKVLN
jgi:GNAT superfamily N-acetyltransferase